MSCQSLLGRLFTQSGFPPYGCWGLNLGLLQEQQVLLINEHHSSPEGENCKEEFSIFFSTFVVSGIGFAIMTFKDINSHVNDIGTLVFSILWKQGRVLRQGAYGRSMCMFLSITTPYGQDHCKTTTQSRYLSLQYGLVRSEYMNHFHNLRSITSHCTC